jgi:hypothetical protein
MSDNPVPLNGGTSCIAFIYIIILTCLSHSLIILIPVMNEFFRGICHWISGKCSCETGNKHEGDGLDCVVSWDSSV